MASLQARYGFIHHPFYDEDAMQNPYLSFGRHQQLLYLHHLLAYSPYLITLIGENGAGKTTFIHQFLNEVRSRASFEFHAFSGSDFGSKPMLLATLGKILKLSGPPIMTEVADLRACLATLPNATKATVLIIDDAHLCPLEVLEMIVELQVCSENKQKLKFLLIGDQVLNTQMLAIKSQVSDMPALYLLPFENFNFHETLGYIKHHFDQAGVKDYGGIPKKIIKEISKESRGQPKRINDMVLEGLLAKDAFKLPKTRRFKWPSLQTTSYTLSAVAIALMLLVIVLNGSVFESGDAALLSNNTGAPSKIAKTSLDRVEKEKKIEKAPLFSDTPLIPETFIERSWVETSSVTEEKITSFDEPTPEIQSRTDDFRTTEPTEPSSTQETQPAIEAASDLKLTSLQEPVSIAADIPDLMNIDPNHFGIQVFGAWELSQARNFQKEKLHRVPLVAFVVETRRDNNPWYILIAGEFDTYADAKAVSEQLPENVSRQQPWIRKYASIQSSAVKTHP